MWWAVVMLGLLARVLTLAWVRLRGPQKPKVVGGTSARMQGILDAMPTLHKLPSPPLGIGGTVQLILMFLQMTWEEWRFDTVYNVVVEEVHVTLPGKSTPGHPDIVRLRWVSDKALPPPAPDAPIVVVCPGLSCYSASLPGTSLYPGLLAKGWRVAVYEKRGVGPLGTPPIKEPVYHLFGHPSDLHTVMLQVQEHYPKAPLHMVGISSGNGVTGSYCSMYADQLKNLRSCLLLIGGEDYNEAFTPPRSNWLSTLLCDYVLLPAGKERFAARNVEVLSKHSKKGYDSVMSAPTLQEVYNRSMLHFSGYTDREEAERRINAFSGGCECLTSMKVPLLVVATEDDPIAPGGPKDSWVKVITHCERAALASYPNGSHVGCYDGWHGKKWVDRLAVEWVEAAEADGGKCRVPFKKT